MAAKKPTRAELEAEVRLLKRQKNAGAIATVLINLIRWSGLTLIAYFAYLTVASLSGETTTADIGIKLFADVRLSEVFAYLFGGGGVIYGARQRSLRRNTIERLQGRIKKLEKERDPGRTSSGLTQRGATHPKDQ